MIYWLIIGCQPESSFTPSEQQTIFRMAEPTSPTLDSTNRWDGNNKAIIFGEELFFSEQLSPSGVACSTCHDPTMGFSDGFQNSEGTGITERHSPTLFATANGTWFRWDGGCDSLWCQAIGPIEHPNEMNSSRGDLAVTIFNTPELRSQYEDLFGDMPDFSTLQTPAKPDEEDLLANENWNDLPEEVQIQITQVLVNTVKSIAAYETTIQPKMAPIDQFIETFLEDESSALDLLTPAEERGLRLFVGAGECHFCHSGPLFTNDAFHNVGLGSRDWLSDVDTGRYDGVEKVQKNAFNSAGIWSDDPNGMRASRLNRLVQSSEQLGQYKTPTLRNLGQTAPYMHGGHFENLEEVVTHYISAGEIPSQGHTDETIKARNWTAEEIDSMIKFLLLMDDQSSL